MVFYPTSPHFSLQNPFIKEWRYFYEIIRIVIRYFYDIEES